MYKHIADSIKESSNRRFVTTEEKLQISKINGIVQTQNNIDSQIKDVMNLSSLIIDLKSLGVREGSSFAALNTDILKKMIETYPKGERTFYLSKGEYYFNPIDVSSIKGNIVVVIKGESNGIETSWFKPITTNIITNKQDFIYDRRENSPGITFYVNDIRFSSYKGFGEVPSGVCFGAESKNTSEYNFHFYNVAIHGFDYGFKSPGYSCGGSGGKNISISTCHYGIYVERATHLFDIQNLELTYNRVGVRLSHGGSPCTINNVHVATGYLGADRKDFEEYIVFHTKGSIIIDNVYQEAYENSALPERTILFDYEGWAFGCGPLTIKNTPIGKLSGAGGKWLRVRTYLGAGPETNTPNPITISMGSRADYLTHYPMGVAILEGCGVEKFDNNVNGLLEIIDVPDVKFLFGLITGRDLKENGKIIFGSDARTVNFMNINNELRSFIWHYQTYNTLDYNYLIPNIGGFESNNDSLRLSDLPLHPRNDIKMNGILTITDVSKINDYEFELGLCTTGTNYEDKTKFMNFTPIAVINNKTYENQQFLINEFIKGVNFQALPFTMAFAYRFKKELSTQDIPSSLIKFKINIDILN